MWNGPFIKMTMINDDSLIPQDQARMFPELTKLLNEANALAVAEGQPASEALKNVMRAHHYWPALQLKWFHDHSDRVLLHNTYKRTDVSNFQALYDECRSVVLDISSGKGHVVVSLANPIPERLTVQQFTQLLERGDMKCFEESFEGTVVSVYYHGGEWRFGTTSCPTVDRSRYFHRTKTHGEMLDDALVLLRGDLPVEGDAPPATVRERARARSQDLRAWFGSKLDPACAYAFILVHHENRHFVDYTRRWGAGYAKLVHITTRSRATQDEISVQDSPIEVNGLVRATRFDSATAAQAWLESEETQGGGGCFGFMAWDGAGKLYKVQSNRLMEREVNELGNPNPWMNMLHVYIQNKPHYQVKDYIAEFKPDVESDPSPVYLIHTVMLTMRDILFDLYQRTTRYQVDTKRYMRVRGPMGEHMDTNLPPVIYFHLKELRHVQITTHAHAFLTPRTVYHYLFHQTLKNLRMLIDFFATTPFAPMHPKAAACFAILAAGMRNY